MKGATQFIENEVITMTPEQEPSMPTGQTLRANVEKSLQEYFSQLDGQSPSNLWGLVMAEVEKPLIEMVLRLTHRNQSKAAIALGISRGTLRKKMAIYGIR